MNDNLFWLLKWYNEQCNKEDNKDLADVSGIKIGTMDNPGWHLEVSLNKTELQNQSFKEIEDYRTDHDWIYCSVKEKLFGGYGGPFNLPEIFQIFREWAEGYQNLSEVKEKTKSLDNNLLWLIKWFHAHCDGDWEHCWGISIYTIDKSKWHIVVNLDETELDDQSFDRIEINRSEDDWIDCIIENKSFKGYGGPFNLPEILKIFRNWAESSGANKKNIVEMMITKLFVDLYPSHLL